ncbi:MAG: site-2 protease family protein [Planctomycetota bacterium]|jgi:Zn-dependent protease
MSWRDAESHEDDPLRGFGRPGGDWQGVRPSFDNPLSWSLPLGRLGGIEVRLHLLFLLFIVVELLRSVAGPAAGSTAPAWDLAIAAVAMAALFVIVLTHEFGHCIACRRAGGTANEILMWPLGGLAYCRPPNRWKAHMITVVGGPLVNVVICLVAGTLLGLGTGRWLGVALPNPLTFSGLYDPEVAGSWPRMTLYIVNVLSLVLLLFNLLPVFPLDGGRIVQAALWPRLGYVGSMRFAVRTGYVGAILLGIFGAVMGMWMLVGIALFGGVTCYITSRQVTFTEDFLGFESDDYALRRLDEAEDASGRPSRSERRARRQAERDQARERAEVEEIDQILEKIGEHGLDSLSGREKRLLRRASERRRDGS